LHRLALNALRESAETRNDFARLANHASGAKDPEAVLEYAPTAARQASMLGAHRQAAAHYKTALKNLGKSAPELRAELLDAYADECSLLNQRIEAKEAQEEALEIWQELGQRVKEGRAYRRLSEIDHEYLFGPKREQYIIHAIELLETLPPSKELARAYGQMARVHLSLNEFSGAEPIYWGSRAIELAEQLGDVETLVHALSSVGAWEMSTKRAEGQAKLERSLKLSLEHGFQFHVARALANLANELNNLREYAESLRYTEMGIEYCIQHDLDYWLEGFLIDRAISRFKQGYWAEAEQDARTALEFIGTIESVSYLESVWIILHLQVRRGEPPSPEILRNIIAPLSKANDLDTRCLFAAIFAERAWLNGDLMKCRAEAEPTYQSVLQLNYKPEGVHDHGFSELSYYLWRAGAITEPLAIVIEPYASQIRGNWRKAAAMWEKIGCPYEQGMALMDGNEIAQLKALEIFERLGAKPIIEVLKQQMRAQGIRIPRGARPTTRENPFGLTAREMDILSCLINGLSNHVIAKQLSLSTRTVEHHISSILQKMEVQSRNEAVARAVKNKIFPSA
jgi:DNA-binding CsgD family transcriptional regulator/tetratricopeptide (TPR) repeat protein